MPSNNGDISISGNCIFRQYGSQIAAMIVLGLGMLVGILLNPNDGTSNDGTP